MSTGSIQVVSSYPPVEKRGQTPRHQWESELERSLPHFAFRLEKALHELEAICAISAKEKSDLLELLKNMNIKKVATELASILGKYDDDSVVPPNPRFPSLKRPTFKPRVYEILTAGWLQEDIRQYILDGFRQGFKVGWEGFSLGRRVAENPRLLEEGQAAVLASVLKDWEKGIIAAAEIWGDDDRRLDEIVISPVYTVAKRFMGYPIPGKRRRVFNLSRRFTKKENRKRRYYPSVNDDIDPQAFSCSFAKLSDAVDMVRSLREKGHGVWMARADIEDAFCHVPVRDQDMHLLAFSCEVDFDDPAVKVPVGAEKMSGKQKVVFVNGRFPFGLRSAPAVFETLAQTVRQIARFVFGVQLSVGYLDDVLVLQTTKERCEDDLSIYIAVLRMLGLSPQLAKCSTEASTTIDFLGLDIDSVRQEIRMPEMRIQRMKEILAEWAERKECKRVELESLIGTLQHMTKGVPAGRMFLRRIIDLLWDKGTPVRDEEPFGLVFGVDENGFDYEIVGGPDRGDQSEKRRAGRKYKLTAEFQLDITWWRENMEKMNHHGFPFLTDCPPAVMEFQLATDASDKGFGGRFGNEWFSYPWMHGEAERFPIAYRELYAVVVAVGIWGHHFSGRIIHFLNDNTNTIIAAKKASSRNHDMMHLLRILHSMCVDFGMHVWFDYINTVDNNIADALSRLEFDRFFKLLPTANPSPTPLRRPMPEHPPRP